MPGFYVKSIYQLRGLLMSNSHEHKEINYSLKSNWAHSHPVHSLNDSHSHKKILELENGYRYNNSLNYDKRNLSA